MSTEISEPLESLGPYDLAAVYIGTFQMLQDLNKVTKRLPGGRSTRIQLAHLYLMRIEDVLRKLTKKHPDRIGAVCDYLELSQERAIRSRADDLRAALRDATRTGED